MCATFQENSLGTCGFSLQNVDLDPASMNPKQLTSTPAKQDLLHEEIQKLAMQTQLEVQQRKDIRWDLAERMNFVPPDLRAGEHVFSGKKIRARSSKDGIW